jgi:hypothetical protein
MQLGQLKAIAMSASWALVSMISAAGSAVATDTQAV